MKNSKTYGTSTDTEYVDTLSYFYSHSNENEVDGLEIARIVQEYFVYSEKLDWLDVGCGPGGKLAIIAEHLAHWGGPSIELVGLDPSDYWLRRLEMHLGDGIYGLSLAKTVNSKWEEYVSFSSGHRFDLITFMHSVYGLESDGTIIPSLLEVSSHLKEEGLIAFVVESPNSDLYKLKSELFDDVLDFDLVDYRLVENTLRSSNLSWKCLSDSKQKFKLGQSKEEALNNATALSFIIQTKPEEYNSTLETDQKKAIKKSLSDKLKEGGGEWYISIPDRTYLAEKV